MSDKPISVADYFVEHTPAPQRCFLMRRSINALVRGDIKTMDVLALVTPRRIARVRNLGGKCLELVLMLREQYIEKNGISSTREP